MLYIARFIKCILCIIPKAILHNLNTIVRKRFPKPFFEKTSNVLLINQYVTSQIFYFFSVYYVHRVLLIKNIFEKYNNFNFILYFLLFSGNFVTHIDKLLSIRLDLKYKPFKYKKKN